MNGMRNAGRKLRVLVVEDDPDALTIYAESLRFAGCEVLAVMTRAAAVDAARQAAPDVIVLDCRLPDGDGLSLLESWRRTEVARVPVVVVTASTARQEVEAALLAGAAAFVQKPCSGEAIARFVTRVANLQAR